jgi:hypothetical protein
MGSDLTDGKFDTGRMINMGVKALAMLAWVDLYILFIIIIYILSIAITK